MMRFLMVAVLIGLAGCSTAPISYTAPVPRDDTDAYSCALRTFNELGFAIANADRGAAFLTGEKQTSGFGTAMFTGKNYFDHITVSIFEDGNGGETMRVTAGSRNESAMSFGNASGTTQAPQDSAKEAARQILQTCATGEIREQGSDTGTLDASL